MAVWLFRLCTAAQGRYLGVPDCRFGRPYGIYFKLHEVLRGPLPWLTVSSPVLCCFPRSTSGSFSRLASSFFCLLRVLGLLSREALLLFAERLPHPTHRSSDLEGSALTIWTVGVDASGQSEVFTLGCLDLHLGFWNWGPIIYYGASFVWTV